MILKSDPSNEIFKNGNFTESTFKIQSSAKAFKILSDNLYTNKIRAVVRELSTNAIDACIEAGKDVEIETHLPTLMSPYFSVKDKGIGMSHQQVEDLYTTYFSSSKASSNDQIGALGLGSKSPFAYTKSFSIETQKEGNFRSYNCYVDSNGTATLALMHETTKNDPDGTTIKLAVQSKDITYFTREAAFVYSGFDVKPKILGNIAEYEENVNNLPSVVLKKDNWTVYYYERYYSHSYARMGGILYPLDTYVSKMYQEKDDRDDTLMKAIRVAENNITVDFPLGSLDIAPSREELSYDEDTIETITRVLAEVNDSIKETIQKEIDSKSTYWDKVVALNKYDCFRSNFMEITLRKNQKKVPLSSICIKIPPYSFVTFSKENGYIQKQRKDRYCDGIEPDNNSLYVNVPSGVAIDGATASKIVRQVVPNYYDTCTSIYLIKNANDCPDLKGAPLIEWEEIKEKYTPVKKISNFANKEYKVYFEENYYEFLPDTLKSLGKLFTLDQLPPKTKKIYVVVKGEYSYNYYDKEENVLKKIDSDYGKGLLKLSLAKNKQPLLMLPSKVFTKFKKQILEDPSFIPFTDFIKKDILNTLNKKEKAVYNHNSFRNFYTGHKLFVHNVNLFKTFSFKQESPFGEFIDLCSEVHSYLKLPKTESERIYTQEKNILESKSNYCLAYGVDNLFSTDNDLRERVRAIRGKDYSDIDNTLIERYPLLGEYLNESGYMKYLIQNGKSLEFVGWYNCAEKEKDPNKSLAKVIVDYINFIENSLGEKND